jgi:hypothetical protein
MSSPSKIPPAQIAEARRMAGVEADQIAKRRRQRMIRIAITPAACHAICSTLPEDALLWPLQRQDGQVPHPHRGGRP